MTHRALLAAALAVGAFAVPLGAVVAPPDAVQGEAQRLMYLHVPAAWCAYLCFAVVLVANVRHLARRTPRSDAVARAAAETGVVLTAATLLTGSVWGGLTWGTWWVWDARVTTTVAMGLVYVAYLAARILAVGQRARGAAALLGAAGFVVVPVVHFSVVWWRTLHQPPTILAPSTAPPIDGLMATALAVALVAATLLAAWAVWSRAEALLGAALTPSHDAGCDDARPVGAHPGGDRATAPTAPQRTPGGAGGDHVVVP